MSNIYRIRTTMGGLSGAPYLSTQFYEAIGAPSTSAAQSSADAVDAFWSALAVMLADALTVAIDPTVDFLDETDGTLLDSFTVSTTVTQPSDVGDPLPRATQGLLRINTGVILDGHRIRGRIFVPGGTEVDNSNGAPNGTYTAALAAAGSSLFTAGVTSQLCVWHRPVFDEDGVLQRAGQAVVANSVTASTEWAILRSRRD